MKTRITRLSNAFPLLPRESVRSFASPHRPPLVPALHHHATQSSAGLRGPGGTILQNALFSLRGQRTALPRRLKSRFARFKSSNHRRTPPPRHHDPTPHLGSPEPAPSVSQRLKKLSREYGWTAVGVYFALSVLDFPFCFMAVRLLGTERIGHYEDAVKNAFWSLVRIAFPDAGKQPADDSSAKELAEAAAKEANLGADGLAVQLDTGADATIWTQLGLAYLVHKSLIFFRVPLTAAVLPKVVKTLRKWGYNIGKAKPKPV